MDVRSDSSVKSPEALIGSRILLGFGLLFSLLLFSAAISYYNTHELFLSARELLRSYEIQSALGAILSTMKDAETGTRGYIITGNDAFLEPYRLAIARIHPQFEHLHGLLAKDHRHADNLAALKEKIEARLA